MQREAAGSPAFSQYEPPRLENEVAEQVANVELQEQHHRLSLARVTLLCTKAARRRTGVTLCDAGRVV
ncbi:MAG: hypothetical protein Kow0067_17740 [Coriobacteriia bacterium]